MTELTTGQRIAQCRKQLNLSQEGLGEKVGVSRQAISKWEADAAMPDIDKLITLSKLFQVSVGWLLGVEEMPVPQAESAPITEELLYKLEEVVQRYQPKKKELPRWGKLAIAASAALLLFWGGVKLHREWQTMDAKLSQLSSRLNNSGNSNATILNQLEDLQAQLDSLRSAPEHFSISDYSFQIEPDPEKLQARVEISTIPGSWNEEFSASISVRRGGEQILSQACGWDGTGLKSNVLLPLENGYEYWFTAEYSDGTREQVQLNNTAAENLLSSFTIECHISSGKGYFSRKNGTLTLEGCVIFLAPPSVAARQGVLWTVELVLYHVRGDQRQIADTDVLVDPEKLPTTEEGTSIQLLESTSYPSGPFRLPEVQEGDGFELWIEAEMENGISLERLVNAWTYLDGEFLETEPAES